jgi:hypothetical protein
MHALIDGGGFIERRFRCKFRFQGTVVGHGGGRRVKLGDQRYRHHVAIILMWKLWRQLCYLQEIQNKFTALHCTGYKFLHLLLINPRGSSPA